MTNQQRQEFKGLIDSLREWLARGNLNEPPEADIRRLVELVTEIETGD